MEDKRLVQIGMKLHRFRVHRKLKQEELAQAVGVTVNAVRRWEAGRVAMTVAHLLRAADALEIRPEKLLPDI